MKWDDVQHKLKQNAGLLDLIQCLQHSGSPEISNLLFHLCSKLHYACKYKLPWLKELLYSLRLSCIWSNQVHSTGCFKRIVRQRLRDQNMQEWQSRVVEIASVVSIVYLDENFVFRSI